MWVLRTGFSVLMSANITHEPSPSPALDIFALSGPCGTWYVTGCSLLFHMLCWKCSVTRNVWRFEAPPVVREPLGLRSLGSVLSIWVLGNAVTC